MKKVGLRPKFNPSVILKKIDATRTVNLAGGASFTGFEVKQSLPALHSMLEFPEEAQDLDRPNLIWRSLAAVRGPLTPASFLAELNQRLDQKLATKQEEFHVLTGISLEHNVGRSSHKIGDVRVRLLAGDYPSRYRLARSAVITQQRLPVGESGHGFRRVIVSLRASDAPEAVEKALRALDLLRACWCFLTNFEMEFMGASWRPINKVRLGAVHTCHLPNGKTAVSTVWFEPHHDGEPPAKVDSKAAKSAEKILVYLRSSPLSAELEEAMLGYVRALDNSDQNAAFLSLWTVIERLVSPGRGNFDAFVQRCAFLFEDGEFHTEVLKHLKQYRNEFVHAGRSTSQAKAHCYELQVYFRALVRFYLGQRKFFTSLVDANVMLDLPPDRAKLRRRQLVIAKALKFLA